MLGPKNFRAKQILAFKKISVVKILSLKFFWVHKFFWSENISGGEEKSKCTSTNHGFLDLMHDL